MKTDKWASDAFTRLSLSLKKMGAASRSSAVQLLYKRLIAEYPQQARAVLTGCKVAHGAPVCDTGLMAPWCHAGLMAVSYGAPGAMLVWCLLHAGAMLRLLPAAGR